MCSHMQSTNFFTTVLAALPRLNCLKNLDLAHSPVDTHAICDFLESRECHVQSLSIHDCLEVLQRLPNMTSLRSLSSSTEQREADRRPLEEALLASLQVNESIICFRAYWYSSNADAPFDKKVTFYLELNRCGRPLLFQPMHAASHWPLALAGTSRIEDNAMRASVVFHFLRERAYRVRSSVP